MGEALAVVLNDWDLLRARHELKALHRDHTTLLKRLAFDRMRRSKHVSDGIVIGMVLQRRRASQLTQRRVKMEVACLFVILFCFVVIAATGDASRANGCV